MRRLSVALLLLLLAAPAAALELSAVPVPLNPEDPGQTRLGRLRYLGGLELNSPDRTFGGLSGLSVEGDRLLAVSDRGLWLRARVARDAQGRPLRLEEAELAPLLTPEGRPAPAGAGADAEALARTASGDFLVSFERQHRLWLYAGADPLPSAAKPVAAPREVRFAPPYNGGYEAIVGLADGRVLLIAEDARDKAGDFVAWLLADGRAARLAYGATGQFKPTDAAALPNGDVLVLERRFTGLVGGLAGRLALVRGEALRPGARLDAEEVARFERPLTLDNFEGLAVSRDADGATLVWIVSDDNFNMLLQRTLLLLFELADGP